MLPCLSRGICLPAPELYLHVEDSRSMSRASLSELMIPAISRNLRPRIVDDELPRYCGLPEELRIKFATPSINGLTSRPSLSMSARGDLVGTLMGADCIFVLVLPLGAPAKNEPG